MWALTFEEHGRIYEDEPNHLYVVGWHHFALYYWAKYIAENKIKPGALLIHIDYHTDELDDSARDYKDFTSPDEILKLIEAADIQFDSYVVPAIRWKIVSEIAFCSHIPKVSEYLGFLNHKDILSLEKWLQSYDLRGKDVILNIDLDYFFDPPNQESSSPPPKPEHTIRCEVESINRIRKYASLTTIATSPCCVGDDENRKYVQKLFKKYFEANISLDESRLAEPI